MHICQHICLSCLCVRASMLARKTRRRHRRGHIGDTAQVVSMAPWRRGPNASLPLPGTIRFYTHVFLRLKCSLCKRCSHRFRVKCCWHHRLCPELSFSLPSNRQPSSLFAFVFFAAAQPRRWNCRTLQPNHLRHRRTLKPKTEPKTP